MYIYRTYHGRIMSQRRNKNLSSTCKLAGRMENGASGSDTSGSRGGGAATTARDGDGSVSGLTEVGSKGNAAAAETARCHGDDGDDSCKDDGLRTAVEDAVNAGREAGGWTDAGEDAHSSQASLGWLVLGFLAGAVMAVAMLFLKPDRSPEVWTVPT